MLVGGSPSKTYAAYGSMQDYGYFYGNQQTSLADFVLPAIYDGNAYALPDNVDNPSSNTSSMQTAQAFEQFIESYYNQTNSALNQANITNPGYTQQGRVGAAYIILTMLPNITPGSVSVSAVGTGNYIPQWVSLVNYYASNGLVIWGASLQQPSGGVCRNTAYQQDYHDVEDLNLCDYSGHHGIAFLDPTNPTIQDYEIKQSCGNPVGNLQLPPPPTPSISLTAGGVCTTNPNGQLTFQATGYNTGDNVTVTYSSLPTGQSGSQSSSSGPPFGGSFNVTASVSTTFTITATDNVTSATATKTVNLSCGTPSYVNNNYITDSSGNKTTATQTVTPGTGRTVYFYLTDVGTANGTANWNAIMSSATPSDFTFNGNCGPSCGSSPLTVGGGQTLVYAAGVNVTSNASTGDSACFYLTWNGGNGSGNEVCMVVSSSPNQCNPAYSNDNYVGDGSGNKTTATQYLAPGQSRQLWFYLSDNGCAPGTVSSWTAHMVASPGAAPVNFRDYPGGPTSFNVDSGYKSGIPSTEGNPPPNPLYHFGTVNIPSSDTSANNGDSYCFYLLWQNNGSQQNGSNKEVCIVVSTNSHSQVTITGYVHENGAPLNGMNVSACDSGHGGTCSTSNTTGVRGNYSLTLNVGTKYFIMVTNGPPTSGVGADTLTLNNNLSSYWHSDSVFGKEYLIDPVQSSTGGNPTPTGGWNFDYTSPGHTPTGGNNPTTLSCSVAGFTQSNTGKASAPASYTDTYNVTYIDEATNNVVPSSDTHSYKWQYIPGTGWFNGSLTYPSTKTVNATFTGITVKYQFSTSPGPNGTVSTSSPTVDGNGNEDVYFTAGAYYGYDSTTFSATANYTDTQYPTVYISDSNSKPTTTPTVSPVTGTPSQNATITLSGYPGTTLPPCVVNTITPSSAICNPLYTSPGGYIGTGRSFTMSAGESGYQIGPDGMSPPSSALGDHYIVSFSGPGNVTPNSGDVINSTTYSGGVITYTNSEVADTPGTYTVTWTFSGNGIYYDGTPGDPQQSPPTCSGTFTVANQPYVSVIGGDVLAGSGIEPTCNSNASAFISTWNNNDFSGMDALGFNAGAGTEYAAEAMSTIDGFATDQSPASGPAGNTLTFANSGSIPPNTDFPSGGSFGTVPCSYDYYGQNSSIANGSIGPYYGNLSSYGSPGEYQLLGTQTYSATNLYSGQQLILYIQGDVYLTGNITYPTGGPSPNKMTSLHMIVQGNIYIAPNVTELDGVYVAEQNPSTGQGGTIYTCSFDGSFPGTSTCDSQLSVGSQSTGVGGSFVANTIKFWRTYGTMASGSTVPHSPAEVFYYTPYLWLSRPVTPMANTYDAVSNLPPVL